MRVKRLEAAAKCRNRCSGAHRSVEATFTYILFDDEAFPRDLARKPCQPRGTWTRYAWQQHMSGVVLTAQHGGNQTEKATGGKQDRCQEGWSHDDIENRNAPSPWFALDAANVEDEADDPINHCDKGEYRQQHTSRPTAKDSPDTREHHNHADKHRRIHDALAVAADVVFIGH